MISLRAYVQCISIKESLPFLYALLVHVTGIQQTHTHTQLYFISCKPFQV